MKPFLKTKLPPLLLAVLAIVLDQISKAVVVAKLPIGGSVPIIKGVFHFTHRINYGAAWSMFEDQPWVFMTASALAIVGILVYYFLEKEMPALIRYPLCMILGGGIGNMIDRVFVGYVTDFLDARFIHFPVFNIADCFITVGAGLLFLGLVREFWREEKAKKAAGNTPVADETPEGEADDNRSDT